ncbi:C-GCAxxG-C-C family (seleno)protein [uncultured Ilyobacter sp.]|uniref:C-GCAxxG-C-C family (seleno)protein n=1 Tax=uncultured Ilyobacter sp. TaxID=544433 RepID=UPI0029C0A12D|nr:C-GCAxxG-C-C family (seleno)protein [uncultured Ilyobacter sp.]
MEKINISKIRKTAENYYENGDFYCSEAVIKTLKDVFKPEIGDEVIALASGFPVGMGNAGCTCGAVVGAQMSLGLIFGRQKAKGKEVEKTMELSREIHDIFRKDNKTLCCRILTKDMKLGSKKHMTQCVKFTGDMAEAAAKIIARELSIETEEGYINSAEKKNFFSKIFRK